MARKVTKTSTIMENSVQWVGQDEAKRELGEAFASFLNNPTVTWAKFILTDDRVNGNGQRIPKEEFVNLINTGVNMPVKMALGEIAPGHDESKPLGVITNLKEVVTEEGSSAVVALAALWGEERPADVAFLKERFAQKQPVDISWEILYESDVFNEELGSMDLISTALKAATVVGNPAYMGRTPFLAIAAKKEASAVADTSKENTEENKVEKELQEKLDKALAEIETLKTQIKDKDTAIAELTTQKQEIETELVPLKEFKEKADAELAKAEKLESIKTKFVEAGLEKDEEYFKTNEENLLKLDESALSFMVQELKAFASSTSKTEDEGEDKSSEASTKETKKVPPLHNENDDSLSVKNMAKFLRDSKGKK